MHHFAYRRGVSHASVLHAEEVDLCALADTVGTPFYCYSTATLERHYRVFAEAFAAAPDTLVCYSIKANSNLGVLTTLAALGAGMDVVSEGELRRALAVNVAPDRIAFSGVGKTKEEMAFALDEGIFAFNVESEPELRALSEVAASKGLEARIALRVNPDVDAKTHHKIATGKAENKFGVPFDQAPSLYRQAVTLPGIMPAGVHMHIGSQITDLSPFRNAFALLSELVGTLRGGGITIDFVNLGGGLGIPYRPDEAAPPLPTEYAALVKEAVGDLGVRLLFEPGRMIAGNAGILVSRVLYVKPNQTKTFTIVDAGMNDLIRPTLYEAHHQILPLVEPTPETPTRITDVVGPVCETGDYLALQRPLPELHAGDLIAVMTAGAYGAVQASQYNSRLLVPEVLVSGDRYCVTRPRPSYDDMLAAERLPEWI
ncbi:diaminopimelate decarboxylase [Methyloceanibacter superfactus]|jgi:diaminopimelate decarboxylase|uniref:Diaminopimelate decarboxylase n=1 Tax=Methyloceanibacter superfactus TaxID=1774969 RepID=A0A1E3W6E8_9HYPH|nr:diaminopimelate decarboxylase [Methyloceanibacter superfactus]ODS01405.1 diaminopimelate decarboxylase [Methyloceanibacter superfactus]